jgi:hypothetical protein
MDFDVSSCKGKFITHSPVLGWIMSIVSDFHQRQEGEKSWIFLLYHIKDTHINMSAFYVADAEKLISIDFR